MLHSFFNNSFFYNHRKKRYTSRVFFLFIHLFFNNEKKQRTSFVYGFELLFFFVCLLEYEKKIFLLEIIFCMLFFNTLFFSSKIALRKIFQHLHYDDDKLIQIIQLSVRLFAYYILKNKKKYIFGTK